jgi:hypothetical protein
MPQKRFDELSEVHREFIAKQKMFFVATAAPEGRINIAPKDMESLRVTSSNQIVWLNLTGAENETAAHLLESPRMTLMWCSFDQKPMILRVYGEAVQVHSRDDAWEEYASMFPGASGARQFLDLSIDLVLISCGFGVPLYDFVGYRDTLRRWSEQKGEEGLRKHWAERNQLSIDGKPTNIF